eukprot:scaffold3966_cov126-Isochrysis_galbana.AAC.2
MPRSALGKRVAETPKSVYRSCEQGLGVSSQYKWRGNTERSELGDMVEAGANVRRPWTHTAEACHACYQQR